MSKLRSKNIPPPDETEILFDAFPKQLEFMTAVMSGRYSKILYGGAIRGGKTFAGLGAILLLCKNYPGSRWAIVRDTWRTIQRNTLPSFNKIKPGKFIQSFNQDTQTITCTNGSQIIFFAENYDGDKELNRWRGLEVNGFLLEEVNELQEVSFDKAIERAGSYVIKGRRRKPPPLILMTCNPSNNWVKRRIYGQWQNGAMPDGWLYIPSRIYDNPFIASDAAYMQSIKDMPRYQYEVFVEGNWDIQLKTGGEFYKCFELDRHVGQCRYNPNLALHISWDDNVNPYLPLGIFQIDGPSGHRAGRKIFIIDEIAGENPRNTVRAVCDEFRRRFPKHRAALFIYGDATSQKEDTRLEKGSNFFSLIQRQLSSYHPTMRLPKSNPSVAMRGNFINTVLDKEYGGISILIDENCRRTINDFVCTKEEADGSKNKRPTTDPHTGVRYQQHGHFSDCFDYFICSAFAADYNNYQHGDKSTLILSGKNFARHGY